MTLPPKKSLVKPFSLAINPRSRLIIQDFVQSKLPEAIVDTSWSDNPRRVYEKLHKYLTVNSHLGISVILNEGKVILKKHENPEK